MQHPILLLVLLGNVAAASLPPNAVIYDLVSGPSGTLYAAGSIDQSGFIAQLPDGYVFRTIAPAAALAVSADGSVFATGTANSDNFQSLLKPAKAGFYAFVIKLDRTGSLQYTRLVDSASTYGLAIAVNSAGEALVSGTLRLNDDQAAASFLTTPGAVTIKSVFNYGFVIKLDASGQNTVVSILGYGGGPVAFDGAGNMYVTGQLAYSSLNPTPGALQAQHGTQGCGGTSYVSSPCFYEYVAKISTDGTQLMYATYLTGQYGSKPTAIFVDPAGNAIIAGTTASHDFPVTPGAFATENHGKDGPSLLFGFSGAHPPLIPPPTAGVISKINNDGTALLWSTYFGGSGLETITGAHLDAIGNIVFTGFTGSPDLPGAMSPPRGCSPSYLRLRPYVAKVSADGTSVLGASYIDLLPPNAPKLALTTDGFIFFGAGNSITNISLTDGQPAACILDAADLVTVNRIAPNQLLTIFTSRGTTLPQIYFNGTAGDILYSGPNQINVRVPAKVTGPSVIVSLDTPSGPLNRKLTLVAAAPSGFVVLTPTAANCSGSSYLFEIRAVARNADGTSNSCAQPAVSGSVITFFLNGLGDDVSPNISIPAANNYGTLLSFDPDPDSLGVWRVRVQVRLPSVPFAPQAYGIAFSLLVNGQPVRDDLLIQVIPVTD